MNNIKFRPLNDVTAIVQAAGLEITYAYDDLVFLEHSEIILQFDDNNEKELKLFLHKDLGAADRDKIQQQLGEWGSQKGYSFFYTRDFELKEKEVPGELDIVFY